ncbi:hypothetical protein CR513_11131, partial [Mucuna pruriens]
MPNYYWWTNHDEELQKFPPMMVEDSYYGSGEQWEELNPYKQMIMDHVGLSIGQHIEKMKENPNHEAKKSLICLQLHKNHCGKDVIITQKDVFNRIIQLMDEMMPKGNIMLHICIRLGNQCKIWIWIMTINRRGVEKKISFKKIYYFPLIPRQKRLHSSIATTSHMRWHNKNQKDPGVLCHPSDGESCKHFDRLHLEFSQDPRNMS